MKYSDREFELKKDYVEWLRERRDLFREVTGTNKSLRLTMIATSGVKQNMYSSALQIRLSLEDLFIKKTLRIHDSLSKYITKNQLTESINK